MNITIRRILDKYFLPCFYGFCILGIILAVVFFVDVKKQQKEALLAYEKNLNIKSTNESIKLELNEKNKKENLIYSSSNEEIVKIDNTGNLISVGEGSAVITVYTKDKKKSQKLVVNVGQEAIAEYIKNNPDDNKETAKTEPIKENNSSTINKPEISDTKKNPTEEKKETEKKEEPIVNNKQIEVTDIKLNKKEVTIGLNSKNKTATLTATISPSNATNKNITWSSSKPNVATINNGVVTAKGVGTTTITATTLSGKKKATATITVTKKVVIIIGASQVTRMAEHKKSYTSNNYNYNTENETLIYVYKSGSGIDYQTNAGFQTALSKINSYKEKKDYVNFYIYFPLVGNTIQNFTCDDISSSNSTIKTYASNYNNKIMSLKNNGYKVKGYVTSMHPVKVSQAPSSKKVVTNENKDACTAGYRSNWKYFQFNKTMKNIVETNYSNNLKYQALFNKIMETNNNKKNFSYKITYNTTDGIHWDKDTTNKYVNMMLDYSGDL